MHRAVLALALFTAVAASAQINVSDEVVSDPLRPRALPLTLAQPAVSLAKDRGGVAIAWVMGDAESAPLDRIYVARLDGGGHSIEIRTIAPLGSGPTLHQETPSLAPLPGGDGFLLAWLEMDQRIPAALPTSARPVYCLLDSLLTPTAPAALFFPLLTIAPTIARTRGGTTWISAVGQLWTVTNGVAAGPLNSIAATDMTLGTEFPQVIGAHTITTAGFQCRCPATPFCPTSCIVPNPNRFVLDFASIWTTSQTKTFDFPSELRPAIASNGRDVLAVWFSGAEASGGDLVSLQLAPPDFIRFNDLNNRPRVLAHFDGDFGDSRPDITADADRYVMVWRSARSLTNHDVVGLVMEKDGSLTPLTIAATSADERDPAILPLGGDTFLVAYEKNIGTDRRIAGRFVHFGRVHVVR